MGNAKRVGIRQIANALSLSTCTVSRILNDKLGGAKYREETIARVRNKAAELGYRPNLVARSLVSGSTRTLGLCVGDIANPMFAEFTAHFERAAMGAGYATFTCNIGEDPATEIKYVDMLLSRGVDALVVSPATADVADMISRAAARGCRVVLFDRAPAEPAVSTVLVDNRAAMKGLAARALALGHTRVGVITGSPDDAALVARLEGVRDAVREAGLDAARALATTPPLSTTVEAGAEGMRVLWAERPRPTFVLALANVLSLGGLSAARELGILLGEELSFAGFDDFPGATLMRPQVTVVAQPVRELAEACAQLACTEPGGEVSHQVLKTTLHWRASVQPIGAT